MSSDSPIVDRVLERLTCVKLEKEGQYSARCPSHDDRRASLSISVGKDGRALLKCQAGCGFEQVANAIGLDKKDLFPPKNEPKKDGEWGKIDVTYDYTDEAGNLLFQVCRMIPKDFRQRRPNPNAKGGWTWSVKGVRPVLYRLQEVVQAVNERKTIFVVEGEKDVDNLRASGLVATTNAGGAEKWIHPYNEALRGARVVLLPDNDAPGSRHMQQIAASLFGIAESIRVVELPDLPPKGDVSDWLEKGGTATDLVRIAHAAPEWKPATGQHRFEEASAELTRLTDLGNASRLARLHGQDIRYCHRWEMWFVWDGTRWVQDDGSVIMQMARGVIPELLREAADLDLQSSRAPSEELRRAIKAKYEETISWAKESAKRSRIEAMVALARSEPGVPVRYEDLDADPWLLNVQNGTVDLHTGELKPHQRENLCTRIAPVTYDPNAQCPRWLAFLRAIFGNDEDLIAFVQKAVGYSATGDVREQCLFFLHGGGSNGKSTFAEMVLWLLGGYADGAAPDLLMASPQERHPADVADLYGLRCVRLVEVDEGRRFAEAKLKLLTGGDRIKARRMRENFWSFSPLHKVWLLANHKPGVRGSDHGFWRRIRLIPFLVQFVKPEDVTPETPPEHIADLELTAKLRTEAPGILAWIVQGCLRWQREGLGRPEAVRKATEAYRSETDLLGSFLADRCILLPNARAGAKELLDSFNRWLGDQGERTWLAGTVKSRLLDRGFVQKRTGHNGSNEWQGIGLLDETRLDPSSTATEGLKGTEGESGINGNYYVEERDDEGPKVYVVDGKERILL